MYKISYEKCVCFIFLVILAVLSCSGFRIDNLAMTDISKRNSHTSSSLSNSDEFFDRIFNVNHRTQSVETVTPTYHHRIRHHRQLRAQAHTFRQHDSQKTPTGHIDARVFPQGVFPLTTQTNEQFAQIPSTPLTQPFYPTRPIITRSQRSSQHRRPSRKQLHCQGEDITRKTYLSQIVVHAKAQSILRGNLTDIIQFKVIEIYQNSSLPVDDSLLITYHKENSSTNCERNEQIKPQKEYVLFLKSTGAHNYTVFMAPEKLQRKTKANTLKIVRKISNPKFRPRAPEISSLTSTLKKHRLQLVCKVKGLPIPYITWTRNGNVLHKTPSIRITYNKKRKSTLLVKNYNSTAKYECQARGVNGTVAIKAYSPSNTNLLPPNTVPCKEKFRSYCQNGGTCLTINSLREFVCQCPENYYGTQCQSFKPGSTYTQPSQYACSLGLQTKYFC